MRRTLPNSLRAWPPGRPIDQLDSVNDGQCRTRGDLCDAADIACRDHVRPQSFDSPDFARAQPPRNVGLQYIVCAGRPTAKMTLRHILHVEAQTAEQLLRLPRDPLAVLQRTRCV